MAAPLSARGRHSFTAFKTAIPEITNNIYDADSNPSGIISLALSENHLIHSRVTDYINQNFKIDESTATTYSGTTIGGIRLRCAMAKHVNKYFNPHIPIEMKDISMANGVTAILSMLSFILGDVGDGILLMRPIYGKFENDLTITSQCQTLYVDMLDTDPFSPSAVDRYEARYNLALAFNIRPRALLICNPHNPTGRCYPASTLRALLSFCSKHNLHLISDELYALSVFETEDRAAAPFTSVLSIDTKDLVDPALVHVEYGVSKDFGVPGLHVAGLVTRNEDVQMAFAAIGLLHVPSGLSCAMAAAMLEDEAFVEETIEMSTRKLGENYEMVTGMLEEAGIGFWKGGRAGFFIWVDLRPFLNNISGSEVRLAEKLLNGGVWLNPGEEWAEEEGWFRIIFSHDKRMVQEGIWRIIQTLGESSQSKDEFITKVATRNTAYRSV